jgi:hypothetical protein
MKLWGIKSHNIVKLTTYLQQSLNFGGLKKVVISKIAARKTELNVPAIYLNI